ncbi:hypothetical protein [Pleionea sp. CnH1-48]|uniref:hypothetical protein n=1 Tax=Pleionea sp. CnH1-48 TaxID=2954494 RepID=UPI002096D70D|nr:hypothetical protein [Pleionea sp. CnH1-48]MCO7227434.1 hypothetical protein [Pleionea sp. CnH1-48]
MPNVEDIAEVLRNRASKDGLSNYSIGEQGVGYRSAEDVLNQITHREDSENIEEREEVVSDN